MPWFKRADGVVFCILEQYEDTLARVRAEGWTEVPGPTTQSVNVAAQAEVVTPASSPERAALAEQAQADTSDTKKASVAKRTPVKAKTVRRRQPVRKPAVRKAVS